MVNKNIVIAVILIVLAALCGFGVYYYYPHKYSSITNESDCIQAYSTEMSGLKNGGACHAWLDGVCRQGKYDSSMSGCTVTGSFVSISIGVIGGICLLAAVYLLWKKPFKVTAATSSASPAK